MLAALFCKTCKSCIQCNIISVFPDGITKVKESLIKALYNASRASKGNRCSIMILKANSLIHFRNQWFDKLIPSQILMNGNSPRYLIESMTIKAWYLGRFATFYHHQTIQTSISMYLRSDSCCYTIRQDWQVQHSGGFPQNNCEFGISLWIQCVHLLPKCKTDRQKMIIQKANRVSWISGTCTY